MKTTIYLIRHGQTEWNVQRRMQGRQDSPLTGQGVEAAEQLATVVPEVGAVYSSPSGRALHTARLLFGERNVEIDDRLQEINLGEWEGRLHADLDSEEPEQHTNFWKAPHLYQRPGSENFKQVADRATACFQEISARHEGGSVAVVSHTTVIRSILFSIDPRPLSDFWTPPAIYPASISEVEICEGLPEIIRFGCTSHHDTQHTGAY